MPQVLFQFKPVVSEKDGSVLESLARMLNQHKMKYDGIQKRGEGLVSVDFSSPEDAKNAYKSLDGKEFMDSYLTIKPGRGNNGGSFSAADQGQGGQGQGQGRYMSGNRNYNNPNSRDQDGYPENGFVNERNQNYNNYNSKNVDQYPCRILIPSDMVKVVLGKSGATITAIQSKSNTKIDIHREKGAMRCHPSEDTLTSIKGDPESFSEAVREIITVVDKEYQKHNANQNEETRPLQLKLLAHDSLCGRIIGKSGSNLKQVKTESGVSKLIISNSIYEDGNQFVPNGLLCTGERVITIEGTLDAICAAEKIISCRLRDYMERDMKNNTNNGPPMMTSYYGSGILNNGYNYPPQVYQQRSPYGYNNNSNYMGYQGYAPGYMSSGNYPGILGNGYPPFGNNNMGPSAVSNNCDEETACVIIPTKEVGAIIGRNGGYINRVKQYSGARVRVIKGEEGEEGGESRVEVTGTPDTQWRASLCVYNKIKETMKVPYSEAQLKTEYMVPGNCVGRIIGKKGQVVQDIQDKSQTDIEVPKEQQGGDKVPVYIRGTFNGSQIAINRIRDIIHRVRQKSS